MASKKLMFLLGVMSDTDAKVRNLTKSFTTWRKETMSTLKDLQDKIAAEAAQVADNNTRTAADVAALKEELVALKAQLADNVQVTPEQMDGLIDSVGNIFVPAVVEAPVEGDTPVDGAPVEGGEPVDGAPVEG